MQYAGCWIPGDWLRVQGNAYNGMSAAKGVPA